MIDPMLSTFVARSLVDGITGVALVDRGGQVVGLAGAISEEEAMPLAALVTFRLHSPDLSSRLLGGEVVSLALEERDVAVAVAKRQLFVVVTSQPGTETAIARVGELRDAIARMLGVSTRSIASTLPPWSGTGGGGAGPAELPLVEYGITMSRKRGQA